MKKLYTSLAKGLLGAILICGMATSVSAGAKQIQCGKSYWYSAPKTNHYNLNHYSMQSCYNTHWGYGGADQLFYFDVQGTQDVTIKMGGLKADMDIFLFKSYNLHGHNHFKDCKGASYKSNNSAEEITMKNASGRYYLVVDAFKWGVSSSYDLEIHCKASSTHNPHDPWSNPDPWYNPNPYQPQTSACTNLPVIYCGDHKSVSGHSNWAKYTDKIDSHPECRSYNGWNSTHTQSYKGEEVIFKLDGRWGDLSKATIDIKSHDHRTDFDVFVYKKCERKKDPWTGQWTTGFSGLVNRCDRGYSYHWQGDNITTVHLDDHISADELYIVVESSVSNGGWYGYNTSAGSFDIIVSCGDVCDQHMDRIKCGDRVWGKTDGRRNRASYYRENSYSARGGNWGAEMTYKLVVEERTELELDLDVYGYADLDMYLMNGCGASQCITSSTKRGSGKAEHIKRDLHRGTYYVVIEGYRGSKGSYELNVSGCSSCHRAHTITCDKPIRSYTNNQSNDINELRDHCFGGYSGLWLKGKDKTYRFKAPHKGKYKFTLTDLEKDLDLFLITDCDDPDACTGYSTRTQLRDEDITIELNRGEEIFAHVDSRFSSVAGRFTLEVDCDPQEDPAPDPDPEPDPEPDPDPTEECFATTRDRNVITIDVTAADLTSCDTPTVRVMAIPLDSVGQPIMTDAQMLTVTDGKAMFDPGANPDGTDYRICYEEDCNGSVKSCCEMIEYDAMQMANVTMACGMLYEGSTVDGISQFAASAIELCYSSSSSFGGPDEIIPMVKESDAPISVTMFQASANLSLFVLDADMNPVSELCKGSNFNATKDIVNGAAVGEYWTDAEAPLAAGTYYLLVEGYANDIESDYNVSISCGLDCAVASAIAPGATMTGQGTMTSANTESAYLIEESLKVGYTGSEMVYKLDVSEEGDFVIALSEITGAGADMDLFLLGEACDPSSVIAQSITPDQEDETISARLAAGTYYIVADCWKGIDATFTLSVNDPSAARGTVSTSRSALKSSPTTHRAYPNPFADQLYIDVQVAKAQTVEVEMLGVDGKQLYRRTADLQKGGNTIQVSEQELSQSNGIMYYRVTTDAEVLQGKVIRLR
ncbi:MAG: pre-peptidase C-terminal domain-containing protein [Bacteroidota bacterium]